MKPKIKILFFDILTPDKKQRELFNKEIYRGSTYSETTRKMVGLKPEEWIYCDATLGVFPEDVTQFDGVIIGGSTGDPVVGHEKPWMKKTYPYIRKIVKKGIPLLGICGGLQFTARALGGEVVFNPKGKEFGTIRVEVTKEGKSDLLFRGLPKNIWFQSNHKCMTKELLPEWKLLGSSKMCEPQAIGIGDKIRLLQFHPEKKSAHLKQLVHMKKKTFFEDGFFSAKGGSASGGKDKKVVKKFLASIKNTDPAGKKLLRNFIAYFVIPNAHK